MSKEISPEPKSLSLMRQEYDVAIALLLTGTISPAIGQYALKIRKRFIEEWVQAVCNAFPDFSPKLFLEELEGKPSNEFTDLIKQPFLRKTLDGDLKKYTAKEAFMVSQAVKVASDLLEQENIPECVRCLKMVDKKAHEVQQALDDFASETMREAKNNKEIKTSNVAWHLAEPLDFKKFGKTLDPTYVGDGTSRGALLGDWLVGSTTQYNKLRAQEEKTWRNFQLPKWITSTAPDRDSELEV